MRERALIERLLAPLANHPAARGLASDTAVLSPPLGRDLVLTHDILAAGIHYLPGDPPSDIAWKLLAVNLSDLAATGARPVGVLMGLGRSEAEDEAWLTAFTEGLKRALDRWRVPLLGGDTVSGLDKAVLGLTAIGQVEPGTALSRAGAQVGDDLWVTGTIGDAGLGLAIAKGEVEPNKALLSRYRRPEPRLAFGQGLVGLASAAMDVSDGLLIDADRLARASGVGVRVELAAVPVSEGAAMLMKLTQSAMLKLVTYGDDYEILFTAPSFAPLSALADRCKLRLTRIGSVVAGEGVEVRGLGGERVVPGRLGYEH